MNIKEGTLWRLRKHWVPLWNRNLPLRSLCHWRVLNMFYTSRLGKGRKDRCSDIQLSFYKVSPSTETFLKNQKQKITVSFSHFQFIFTQNHGVIRKYLFRRKKCFVLLFCFFQILKIFLLSKVVIIPHLYNRSFRTDLLLCSRCSAIFDYIHLQLSPNFESDFILLNLSR